MRWDGALATATCFLPSRLQESAGSLSAPEAPRDGERQACPPSEAVAPQGLCHPGCAWMTECLVSRPSQPRASRGPRKALHRHPEQMPQLETSRLWRVRGGGAEPSSSARAGCGGLLWPGELARRLVFSTFCFHDQKGSSVSRVHRRSVHPQEHWAVWPRLVRVHRSCRPPPRDTAGTAPTRAHGV